MNDDMSEIMQKINNMINNNQIPDNIKQMMNNVSSSSNSSQTSTNSNFSGNSSANSSDSSSNNFEADANKNSSEFPNFDMATLLKMKSIMDKMNQNGPDPRADLLRSLKPYLRESRKSKVDEYIKLFRIGKIFEMMGTLGGEKKNDV